MRSQHVSGGWIQRGALWVIPTEEAGYHHQADAHSDREHTLLCTLTSLSVGGLRPASDPQGGWLPLFPSPCHCLSGCLCT